jgi:hypothetical protein
MTKQNMENLEQITKQQSCIKYLNKQNILK